MLEVKIKDSVLREASKEMDTFVQTFVNAIEETIGGQLNAENMQQLNTDQITLLAWHYLHDEMMDGGYVQLIHNGFGAFIFKNPFAVAVRNWGLETLYTHIRHAKKYYERYHESIEQDMTDEEFMALYEQMPEFDQYDDDFIVNEEQWTNMIAAYIDDHITDFATIEE
ncbi:DMP19 family protein [Prevotella dentasini]